MVVTAEPRTLAERRADATREAVVEAAWRLSAVEGLTGWSMRQLATDVGLAAPTLYGYFGDKHAIYDAMFEQGYVEAMTAVGDRSDTVAGGSRATFTRSMHRWFAFCTEMPVRHQLMFERVIPDFVPTDEAYAASVAVLERLRAELAAAGVTDPAHLDLWTAISSGLTSQQISNDPGGDRWQRLIDTAVEMFCDHVGIPPDDEGVRT